MTSIYWYIQASCMVAIRIQYDLTTDMIVVGEDSKRTPVIAKHFDRRTIQLQLKL